jgi:hypothetical protein
VIQQLGVFPVLSYRIIVYGDELKPRHSDFSSAVALLEALEVAVPELDVSQLRLNPFSARLFHLNFALPADISNPKPTPNTNTVILFKAP